MENRERLNAWLRENTVVRGVRLNKRNDKDIIDKLNSVGNASGYIKGLIRADIGNVKV